MAILLPPLKRSFTATRCIRIPIVIGGTPGLVGIVSLHVLTNLDRVRSQIPLVNDPVIANHEALDARDTIFDRECHQGKASDHNSLEYVVEFPQLRRRTLPLQYLEVIAVVSGRLRRRVAFIDRMSNSFADRTTRATIIVLPEQAIVRAGSADHLLRVLSYS